MKTSHRATTILLATAAIAATPAAAPAAVREFEGTVVSVNRDVRTFRLHDSERGTKRIKVNSRTRYERVNGFAGLHAGQRHIEVKVRRRNGRWVAIEVEKSGGGGEHGGGDDD
jgi:Domain of unknown function (DUF5666)